MVETLRKPDIYDITVEFGNFRTLQMRRQNTYVKRIFTHKVFATSISTLS